jgi:hypothetical protein
LGSTVYSNFSGCSPQPGACQASALPIGFYHCPSIKKPNRLATEEKISEYKEQQPVAKLSHQGVLRIQELRKKLTEEGHQSKNLFVGVDGSYTNRTVLKQLPSNTTLIGRIRKDCKLYKIPEVQSKREGIKYMVNEYKRLNKSSNQGILRSWKLRLGRREKLMTLSSKLLKN